VGALKQSGSMLNFKPKSGPKRVPQKGEVLWQWRSAKQWNDFMPEVCDKLEHAHQIKCKVPMKIWDGRMLREIDLANMRQMPGRRQIRRIPLLEAATIGSAGFDPTLLAGVKRSTSLPAATAKTESRRPSQSASPARLVRKTVRQRQQGTGDAESGDMHQFVHPALAKMQELRFEFSPVPPQENRGDFQEGHLGDLNSLAEEYEILMREHWLLKGKMPTLPLRGSPKNVMAALSLALFAVEFTDVLPLSEKCRRETLMGRMSVERANLINSFELGELSPVPSVHSGQSSERSELTSTSSMTSSMSAIQRHSRPRQVPARAPVMARSSSAMTRSSSAPQLTAGGRPYSAPAATGRSSRWLDQGAQHATRPLIPFISVCLGADNFESRSKAYWMREAWRDWQSLSASMTEGAEEEQLEALPAHCVGGTGYQWIGNTNYIPFSFDRLSCACQTLWHASILRSSGEVVSNTSLLRSSKIKSRPPTAARVKGAHGRCSHALAFDDAVVNAAAGKEVAVVVVSSQFRVGGNFLTGLSHDVEEEVCSRSNLYFHLRQAAREARRLKLTSSGGYEVHIPDDGSIMSKDVLVFRKGKDQGYAGRRQTVQIRGVFSISWPCRTPGVPAPPDAFLTGALTKKFITVLEGCNEINADLLIVSDEGGLGFKDSNDATSECFAQAIWGATKAVSHVPPKIMVGGSLPFKTVMNKLMGPPA